MSPPSRICLLGGEALKLDGVIAVCRKQLHVRYALRFDQATDDACGSARVCDRGWHLSAQRDRSAFSSMRRDNSRRYCLRHSADSLISAFTSRSVGMSMDSYPYVAAGSPSSVQR